MPTEVGTDAGEPTLADVETVDAVRMQAQEALAPQVDTIEEAAVADPGFSHVAIDPDNARVIVYRVGG
ncbi:MAG TPA: hypothetical protein VGC41_20290, partial [Kofleriaceae bacterium]